MKSLIIVCDLFPYFHHLKAVNIPKLVLKYLIRDKYIVVRMCTKWNLKKTNNWILHLNQLRPMLLFN